MNVILSKLLKADGLQRRSLECYDDIGPIVYTTQYIANSVLGEMKWYITWRNHDIPLGDDRLLDVALYIHDARARMYFPAYLDTRIPPANRENLEELQAKYGIKEYDKFDWIIATKGASPIKYGLVREIEPVDCDFDEIHAIEEIWAEYNRTLI